MEREETKNIDQVDYNAHLLKNIQKMANTKV